MAITYNITAIRGKAAEPVIGELLFENKTIADGLVAFEDDVKSETIFTEASATVTMQAYTAGAPTSQGGTDLFDTLVSPTKVQWYHEFDPNVLRPSRFKRDMRAGVWNIMSTEFEQVVIGGIYAPKVSLDAETKFWTGITSGTKTAIADLTAGTDPDEVSAAEKTLAAALPAALIDGVITKMIYNASNATQTAGVGGRVKVVGTTITASNVKAEYDKIYAALRAEVINAQGVTPYMYAPHSHKQLITIFNNNPANYKDAFLMEGGKVFFNSIEVVFVPLPENVVVAGLKNHFSWCTDLLSDINLVEINKIANNREDMFVKINMAMAAHVANQEFNVLYVG